MVGLFCTYGYKFSYGNHRKISEYCQPVSKSANFAEMHGIQQHMNPIAI